MIRRVQSPGLGPFLADSGSTVITLDNPPMPTPTITDDAFATTAPRKPPTPVGPAMQAVSDLATAIQAGWMPMPEEARMMVHALTFIMKALKPLGIDLATVKSDATAQELAEKMRDAIARSISAIDGPQILQAKTAHMVTLGCTIDGRPTFEEQKADALAALGITN